MAELFLAVGLAWRVPLGVFRDIDEIEGRSLDALAGQLRASWSIRCASSIAALKSPLSTRIAASIDLRSQKKRVYSRRT
jgi:hypothetical protein